MGDETKVFILDKDAPLLLLTGKAAKVGDEVVTVGDCLLTLISNHKPESAKQAFTIQGIGLALSQADGGKASLSLKNIELLRKIVKLNPAPGGQGFQYNGGAWAQLLVAVGLSEADL